MGRQYDLVWELRQLGIDREEIQALWHVAYIFKDCAIAVPLNGKWLMLTIANGHIVRREWKEAK